MAREIIVDEDTRVGYSYQDSLYYVINKNSKTTRRLASSIYKVLQIVHPTLVDKDNKPITVARLIDLANTLEPLKALSYTMSITGDYISSIQLNDYKDSPLVLDLERFKIYIKGTNNIFDITLNEPIYNRVLIIRDYYIEHLGLELTIEQAYIIYGTLYNQYLPHLYNELTNKDEELYYSNIVKLSNPNKDSKIEYSIEVNPFDKYEPSYTTNTLDSINSNRVFTIYASDIPATIGQQIEVLNTYTSDETINSNGTYIISGIEHGLPTYIKVKEQYIPEFKATYTSLNARTNILEVEEINAETNTITCNSHAPKSLLLGSTLYLEGTSIPSSLGTITLDGTYTIKAISNIDRLRIEDNKIYFQETLPSIDTKGKLTFNNSLYNIKEVNTTNNYVETVEPLVYGETITPCKAYTPITQQVVSISSNNITFNNNPNLQVGDSIIITISNNTYYLVVKSITNTLVEVDGTIIDYSEETPLQCSKLSYIGDITTIPKSLIVVEEQLQQDYKPTSQPLPIIYTNTLLGNIVGISSNVVNIDKQVRINKNTEVYIDTNKYIVRDDINSNSILLTEPVIEPTKYLPKYGTIKLLSKVENSKVIVTETNTEELPVGEFILDNYQETISYLELGISNSDLIPSISMLEKTNTIIDITKQVETVLVRQRGTHGEGMLFPNRAKAEEYISSIGRADLDIIELDTSLATMNLIGLMVFVV